VIKLTNSQSRSRKTAEICQKCHVSTDFSISIETFGTGKWCRNKIEISRSRSRQADKSRPPGLVQRLHDSLLDIFNNIFLYPSVSFFRDCDFCRDKTYAKWAELFEHMGEAHLEIRFDFDESFARKDIIISFVTLIS
jgi:hypothetical protein